ncbi:MAG: lipase maturation factor family protein [Patescibacteria group bacterium]|nr:lipase maturation factor family protein [Patescibacteria group bacterium]
MFESLFTHDYWWARFLFQKGLAAVYLFAFVVVLKQFVPLLGSGGLLPVSQFLRHATFDQAPSIFHFFYSDRFLIFVAWSGIALSSAALLGVTNKLPWWGSAALWGLLWVLYLSIVNVGQTFYAFGWESLLLEAGFVAIFLGNNKFAVPILLIFLLRWLLFRLEFGAGLIKIRGDECWRDLTCLVYHHETQPMPGPLSWYFHNLPPWMHTLETAGNHFFQLVVPWGLFFPQPVAAIAAGLIMFSQFWLVLSGNFSWLNWMAIILAFSGFSNAQLGKVLALSPPAALLRPLIFQGLVSAAAILVIFLSWWPIKNMLSRHQLMNASFNPYHIVNTYGAFGSVTKKRYEIVLEGTNEATITPETLWQEYEFRGKPGDPKRRPPQAAPYHLRLDWLMWFASFGPEEQRHWFLPFVEKLLRNDTAALKLLRHNPFPAVPPLFIRARYYLYTFTTPRERKETGAWWGRELVGEYLEPARLELPH